MSLHGGRISEVIEAREYVPVHVSFPYPTPRPRSPPHPVVSFLDDDLMAVAMTLHRCFKNKIYYSWRLSEDQRVDTSVRAEPRRSTDGGMTFAGG